MSGKSKKSHRIIKNKEGHHIHYHCKSKHRCRLICGGKVIKMLFPEILVPGYNGQLTKVSNNKQGEEILRRYMESGNPDAGIFNEDEVIQLNIGLEEVKNIENIDHIAIDLHILPEITQNIRFSMEIKQIDETHGNKRSITYRYTGHNYSLRANEWSKIGERWDRPVFLSYPVETPAPSEIETTPLVLTIILSGITGKLVIDKNIQVHLEYYG